jgi:hypothetical protein
VHLGVTDKTDRTSPGGPLYPLPRAPGLPKTCPEHGQPRIEVEAHTGPAAGPGPDRLRPKPAQIFEDLQRPLDAPRLTRYAEGWRTSFIRRTASAKSAGFRMTSLVSDRSPNPPD